MRVGFLREFSGLRMFSIWLLRNLSVVFIFSLCGFRSLVVSLVRMYCRGLGFFFFGFRLVKADMSMLGLGGFGGLGGLGFLGGFCSRK